MEGSNLMQLGFIELKKGNTKQARIHLMEAVKSGIPDKESLAAAHLQLCNIEAQRMQYKIAKQHFKKAKDLNSGYALKTRDIIIYVNNHFGENISSGSYDDIHSIYTNAT